MRRSAISFVALALPVVAQASAPPLIPITGYLTDDAGAPIDGTTTLSLKLYPGASGASTLWTEVQDVDVVDGQFTVYLGDQTSLGLDLFRVNSTVFLGMAVEDGAEMSPRFEIATSPFAAYAQYCDDAASLGGFDAVEYRLTSDPVDWADLQGLPAGLDDGDANTTYTAGAGLLLAGTEFAVNPTSVEGWARGVAYDSVTELRADLDAIYAARQTCTPNQVLMADGSGAWLCTDSTALPLNEAVIDGFVSNNGYALDAALSTLTGRVATAEGTLSTVQSGLSTTNANLASEVTARTSGVNTLTTNLNAEIAARISAVSGEATTRATADSTLTTNLATTNTNLGTTNTNVTGLATRMTNAEGRLTVLERPRVIGAWYPSTHQTGCSAATYCPLLLNVTRIDTTPGAFTRSSDNYTITINQTGNYQIDAHALVYQNTGSMVNHFEVYKNGNRIQLAHWEGIPTGGWRRYDVHRVESFVAGDRVTVSTYLSEAQHPSFLTHQGPDYTGLSLTKL